MPPLIRDINPHFNRNPSYSFIFACYHPHTMDIPERLLKDMDNSHHLTYYSPEEGSEHTRTHHLLNRPLAVPFSSFYLQRL